MRGDGFVFITIVGFITIVLMLGCTNVSKRRSVIPFQFKTGDIVQVRISGESVMIIHRYRYRNGAREYRCRIGGSLQKQRDGFVSADSEIVRYSLVDFWEMELERETER